LFIPPQLSIKVYTTDKWLPVVHTTPCCYAFCSFQHIQVYAYLHSDKDYIHIYPKYNKQEADVTIEAIVKIKEIWNKPKGI